LLLVNELLACHLVRNAALEVLLMQHDCDC